MCKKNLNVLFLKKWSYLAIVYRIVQSLMLNKMMQTSDHLITQDTCTAKTSKEKAKLTNPKSFPQQIEGKKRHQYGTKKQTTRQKKV